MRLPETILSILVLVAVFLVSPSPAGSDVASADWLDPCNVVWTTPSGNSAGSMPLGNGDLGLNLWVDKSGEVVFYLSKTDAWDAHVRLLKLGRVRLKVSPAPAVAEGGFRQTLKLRQGQIEIVLGRGPGAVTLTVWVDANRPVVRVEARAETPVDLRAVLELWRTKPGVLDAKQRDSARGLVGGPYRLEVPADTVLSERPDRLVWYHRNVTSGWPITMQVQGLQGITRPAQDPLLHRTFGGAILGENLARSGPTALQSARPARRHTLAIYALTRCPATQAEWLADLDGIIAADGRTGLDTARREHLAWWDGFWNRSWIRVEGAALGPGMTVNDLPLRIGASSDGGARFVGRIARPMVFSRALSAEQIAALAAGHDDELSKDPALLGYWRLDNLKGGVFASATAAELPAKVVGEVSVVDAPVGKAIQLAGKGWLEVANQPRLQLTRACTLSAWIAVDKSSSVDGRILDKSQAGGNNGYLLDTYPGGSSLRMITEPCTLIHKDCLRPGRWTHVAATFDSAGHERLFVDGKKAAEQPVGASLAAVTQGYALQRFINACGGRGAMPIKFNGSIFTVDAEGSDGDYRRWGGCFWWQNTRFAYWPMLACGDFDLVQPLVKMYHDALPLAKDITKLYYGHDGAFFAETIYFWGTPCNEDFGWNRNGQPQSLMLNEYIRRDWEGGLELTAMMLDCFDYTQDARFARTCLVPFAEAIATFYQKHYPRKPDGTLRIEPAQSLETWWTAVNPMPEVAGLHAVLPRLVALPADLATATQREAWKRLHEKLPPIPMRKVQGKTLLAPAEEFSRRGNIENPELYAIFPFRLYGVGRKDLNLARASFAARDVKGSQGWQQDPVQAAMLGLGEEAARLVTQRFATKDPGSRFPAFWGPNFDWTPDQCHGGNAMLALQTMILQTDGRKIYLLPAWPKGWDVSFKLHAPHGTTVEGVWRAGKWEQIVVVPSQRAKDVVIPSADP